MGKNLKGKECGKGILQRKDGLYRLDSLPNLVSALKDILIRCQKREIGWKMQNTRISMVFTTLLLPL